MQPRSNYALCSQSVLRGFALAASSYDQADVVAQTSASELLDRLDVVLQKPQMILDAGAGCGRMLPALLKKYPGSRIIMLEPCEQLREKYKPGVLQRLRSRVQHRDECAESISIEDASVDLVVANQSLHWCDLRAALEEFRRILKPGGLLCFATLGPDTLEQLRQSWMRACGSGTPSENRVHRFLDMHDVGDELVRNGFSDTVMDMDYLNLSYQDSTALFTDLRACGARNARVDRPKHLTGKGLFQRYVDEIEKLRNPDGRIELSIEIIYGHAWVAESKLVSEMGQRRATPVRFDP